MTYKTLVEELEAEIMEIRCYRELDDELDYDDEVVCRIRELTKD